jgi:hypothetical protein
MMPVRPVFAFMLALMPVSVAHAKPKLEFAYVVMGAQGAVARAVYKDTTTCPSLALTSPSGKSTQPMSVRALPDASDKKAPFPVLVCELLIPSGTTEAKIDKSKLPLPPGTLAAVAVIGDTGCRLKADKDADHDDEGKFQDCDSKSAWPFSTLARSVAKRKPQLLVHVGDYIYRESPCPKGDKGCKGSPYGDNWDTWKADFFKPAAPLLAAAPWIATRGNHEICARAGDGFMLFLDPTLATGQKPPACGALLDPLTVTVGGQQFVMLDSSNAPDECPDGGCDTSTSNAPACPKPGCSAKAYADQFAALQPASGAWLVSHRPVWGFKNKSQLNATLQAALGQWNGKLPPGFTLAVAGHIHIWETLSFADQRSPQFVIGNGGTSLAHAIKGKLTGKEIGGTTVSASKSESKWGFTIFTPSKKHPGNWKATYYSTKGNDKFDCSVTPTAVSCP